MTATTHSDFDQNTDSTVVAAAFPESIQGRTILITGVNKLGIGFSTAQAFASQGPARLILAARNQSKLSECVEALRADYPSIDIRALIVDLASIASVKQAAKEVLSWDDVPRIDVVVNNAGIMRHGEKADGPVPKTGDGIEDMLHTNHVGHFLLTNLIMPKIIAAAKSSKPGATRIVNLSSSGAWASPFRASDIAWSKPAKDIPENERPNFPMMKMAGMNIDENVAYVPTAAYGASKTCAVLLAVGLNVRLYEKYGILSLALNPGEIKSELGRHTDPEWLTKLLKKREEAGLMHWKSLNQGASTTLLAACDPKLGLPDAGGRGYYLSDAQIAQAPQWAVDKEAAEKLWKVSEELTGENFAY